MPYKSAHVHGLHIFGVSAADVSKAQEASQETSSFTDHAFATAWARMYGNNSSDTVTATRLAAEWSTQHRPSEHRQASVSSLPDSCRLDHPLQTGLGASAESDHAHQSLAPLPVALGNTDADKPALGETEPAAQHQGDVDAPQNAQHQEEQLQGMVPSAGPDSPAQRSPVRLQKAMPAQLQGRIQTVLGAPVLAAPAAAKQQLKALVADIAAKTTRSPVKPSPAAKTAPAGSEPTTHTSMRPELLDLEVQAKQLAMQVMCMPKHCTLTLRP